jgi:hypothetical protein
MGDLCHQNYPPGQDTQYQYESSEQGKDPGSRVGIPREKLLLSAETAGSDAITSNANAKFCRVTKTIHPSPGNRGRQDIRCR